MDIGKADDVDILTAVQADGEAATFAQFFRHGERTKMFLDRWAQEMRISTGIHDANAFRRVMKIVNGGTARDPMNDIQNQQEHDFAVVKLLDSKLFVPRDSLNTVGDYKKVNLVHVGKGDKNIPFLEQQGIWFLDITENCLLE
jgi:hypothetical protein